MPELPEVETLAAQLRKHLPGERLKDLQIWTPSVVRGCVLEKRGQKLLAIVRRGKYMRFDFGCGGEIWIHLGMTGQLFLNGGKPAPKRKHDHVLFRFSGKKNLLFRDVRRFGGLFCRRNSGEPLTRGIKTLGPDPFEFTPVDFAARMKTRTGVLKSLLLNQTIVSGIGNIYADESLHRAGIDPRRRPNTLSAKRLAVLHVKIRKTLEEAISKGGSSIDDYRHLNGASGRFQDLHRVYGQEGRPCRACGTAIRRVVISGRSTHFCPRCQK